MNQSLQRIAEVSQRGWRFAPARDGAVQLPRAGDMDFQVPELGEGVYEAELVEWRVQPGDAVRRGDALAEVLTDKATMELPSPFVGTISALSAKPG